MSDIGLLLLRISAGGMLFFGHGLGKLMTIGATSAHFPDPLHIGSHLSFALVLFGEAFCTLAVMAGAWTKLTAIPPAITMLVAAGIHHFHDIWGKKELPVLYAACFIVIALVGPGSYSVDVMFRKRR